MSSIDTLSGENANDYILKSNQENQYSVGLGDIDDKLIISTHRKQALLKPQQTI